MKKSFAAVALMAALTTNAWAGGLLTNTNQSISFLRNPAREGAIAIDGVYSNPAGVAFLNDGFHLNLNWQCAWQTRIINAQDEMLSYGAKNNGSNKKQFEGKAQAPFLPSIQAAYNKDKWSFQFNFAVTGGGGKCEFEKGIGSFESAVGKVGYQLNQAAELMQSNGIQVPGVSGYDADSYMQGRQFYFGFTVGTAYKINEHLSVYGGLRALYGTASYKAKIENIKVLSSANSYTLPEYITAVGKGIESTTQYVVGQYMQAGMTYEQAMQTDKVKALVSTGKQMSDKAEALSAYYKGVDLQSDQTGFSIAPIIGVDYKIGNFNFSGKYEFRTKMSMKNSSTVVEASQIAAVNQFKDGTSVREDSPAMLALGAQWSALPNLRINAGYHYFFDKDAKKTYCYQTTDGSVVTSHNKNDMLDGGTNEYLGGVEYDFNDKLTVSGGFQITRYGLTEEYMNDMSFVVNSWSFGLGAKYKVSEKVAVEVAYFQTNYDNFNTQSIDMRNNIVSNDYTRTNKVIGAGVSIDF